MGKILKFLNECAQDIGFEIGLFIAGFIGTMSNLDNRRLKPWERVFALISGGAIANYITPMIYTYFSINKNTKFGIAFLLGFSGMEGVKYILNYIRSIIKSKRNDRS